MKKSILIAIIILAVAGLGVWFLTKDEPSNKFSPSQENKIVEIFKVIDGEEWYPWKIENFRTVVPFALQETVEDGDNYKIYNFLPNIIF